MCAPWRTVFCSYTKASQKTQSQCWWVWHRGLFFFFLYIFLYKRALIVFFSVLLNWRRPWSSWRILPRVSRRTPTFCKRFFPTSWKGQRRVRVCETERKKRPRGGGFSDGYHLFFFQPGRRVRGTALHCCPCCKKPGVTEWHEESNFCVWETAELHQPSGLTQ